MEPDIGPKWDSVHDNDGDNWVYSTGQYREPPWDLRCLAMSPTCRRRSFHDTLHLGKCGDTGRNLAIVAGYVHICAVGGWSDNASC